MLIKTLRSIIAVARDQRLKLSNERLKRRLLGKIDYTFTEDYISSHALIWQEYLANFRGRENLKFLEIGSLEGRSAIWLLENILTHPTASITCVDPFIWQGMEPRFDHNIKVSGSANKVIKIKGASEEVLGTLPAESFDVIYIDGCHLALNVLMDAMSSWLLLKPGGIIIFDDYAWEPKKPPLQRPEMAINIFLKALENQVELLHKGYQVIVRKLA